MHIILYATDGSKFQADIDTGFSHLTKIRFQKKDYFFRHAILLPGEDEPFVEFEEGIRDFEPDKIIKLSSKKATKFN